MTDLVTVLATIDEADFVCSQLREFNNPFIGEAEFTPVHIVTKNRQGNVVGGIIAEVGLGWSEVAVLWVDEVARGAGIGSHLLSVLETKSAAIGAHSIRLDTFDWQALDFYKKRGFIVFGELPNYPANSKRYFLYKALDAQA